jgi:hypothetical protein
VHHLAKRFVFWGSWSGFLVGGIKMYEMTPRLPLNLPSFICLHINSLYHSLTINMNYEDRNHRYGFTSKVCIINDRWEDRKRFLFSINSVSLLLKSESGFELSCNLQTLKNVHLHTISLCLRRVFAYYLGTSSSYLAKLPYNFWIK